jgi:N-methylhydantoinase B
MLMLGPDSVIAWTGANNPGYGDPLTRDPHDVARDVSHGWLDAADATRIYGVVWTDKRRLAGPAQVPAHDDGEVDPAATTRLRAQLLHERLVGATAPAGGPPRHADPDTPLRPIGGALAMSIVDSEPAHWVSLAGRVLLGPVTGDYRSSCAVRETPVNDAAPEFATRADRPGAAIRLREYLCPATGVRLATELIRAGDDPVADMELAGEGR